ncbi:hypothetical protein [Maliponia aquimaris]|uniref:hypothetical protein n=1 Tax=Maliponia aquimaris TaxID=1673631 RepID=UPI0011408EC9|nr:hypothetical protein [Maliponia aquimaris]
MALVANSPASRCDNRATFTSRMAGLSGRHPCVRRAGHAALQRKGFAACAVIPAAVKSARFPLD